MACARGAAIGLGLRFAPEPFPRLPPRLLRPSGGATDACVPMLGGPCGGSGSGAEISAGWWLPAYGSGPGSDSGAVAGGAAVTAGDDTGCATEGAVGGAALTGICVGGP